MENIPTKKNLLPRWRGIQRRIGLTGGIASGKSSVSKYLQESKSLPVIDSDLCAHELLKKDKRIIKAIIKRFGISILNQEKDSDAINRKALREIIFTKKSEKLWLETLMHPLIIEKIQHELDKKEKEPILILSIPLLFELNLTNICSEIWVIDCDVSQQLDRLISRDKISLSIAKSMLKSQIKLKEKKDFADHIINNRGKPSSWVKEVDDIINHHIN